MSLGDALKAYTGLGARALATRLGSKRPFKATIVLTERCDCRCEACFIWRKPRDREMTPAEIGGFLRDAPSLRWINLTGGELFLRDDVPDVVAAVKEALPGLAVLDFPTTGQRVERILADVEAMTHLDIPRLFVTVSVDGPPELHDRLRGRPGAFENAVRTYAGLRAMPGVRVYLGMTLSDANAHTAAATLDALRARVPGTDWCDLHLNAFTSSAHYYDNLGSDLRRPVALDGAVAKALRARERSADPTDRIEATYLRLLPEHLRTGRSPLPCRSLNASVFIDRRGDLYPCTVYGRKLGNVLDTPLYALLETAEAEDARRVIAKDACPGCWSPCEANPTIVASLPESILRRPRPHVSR
ncbi:MAG: radical SAM protein [Planctomycetota bacterium]